MSDYVEVPSMKHDVKGQGEPLVLMPGGLTGWLSWAPFTEPLAASRKVIRLQLHVVDLGLSGAPLPPNYALDYEVAALGNTLDELGVKRADFAAWSYGGATSLSYAIHHPERVRSLTLIEPPAYWVLHSRDLVDDVVRDEEKFMRTLITDDVSEAQLVAFLNMVGLLPEGVTPQALPQWPTWMKHRQSLKLADAPYRHRDSIDLVRTFEQPVLCVKGEGSSPSLHAITDVLADEFPNVRVVTYPGGHAPHIVSKQPFLERLNRFLAEGA